VAIVAQNDVWAIGYYTDSMAVEQTLIEHWDGVRWSVVASPDVGTTGSAHNRLHGIAAVSANDIWAVGYFQPIATSQRSTLILHWDGSSWNVVPDTSLGELKAVSALATDDVWAVGEASETYRTLTMHWNGQTWQVVAGPDIYDSTLNGVAMVAANDVWAVGRQFDQFLVEHWDGSAWSAVDVAPPVGYSNSFYGVDALDSNNVWAIGQCCWDPQVATIYHWDGNAWNFSAFGYPDLSVAYGVTAISPDDVWVVGVAVNRGMLITHWDGSQWRWSANPPNSSSMVLQGVTSVSSDDIWAVGYYGYYDRQLDRTTSAHCTGVCSAPTPTPTACPIEFVDVPTGSTFYPYVRCLACRGVLGGYPDDTYRPNDNLSRGQAAKIVSNAAGFSDDIPPSQQTFTDVPPDSTFWVYVERGYLHGVFSGYPCGGQGEPCDPQQRPYYRPGNNLSRGQLAKVASNGAGYIDQISPTQASFVDVPADDPFWIYVERAVAHSIISGYPCGGVGESCDEYNRPYFRPAASVSRGQTAKIVSSTFFPDCQTP
jgi:hypothetical protein